MDARRYGFCTAPNSTRSTGRPKVSWRASLKSKYRSSVRGPAVGPNSTRKSASLACRIEILAARRKAENLKPRHAVAPAERGQFLLLAGDGGVHGGSSCTRGQGIGFPSLIATASSSSPDFNRSRRSAASASARGKGFRQFGNVAARPPSAVNPVAAADPQLTDNAACRRLVEFAKLGQGGFRIFNRPGQAPGSLRRPYILSRSRRGGVAARLRQGNSLPGLRGRVLRTSRR